MMGTRLALPTLALFAASMPCASHASSHAATLVPRPFLVETNPLKRDLCPKEAAILDRSDLSTRGGASDSSNEIVSAAAFFFTDYAVRKVFQANDITFPSQLGGCIIFPKEVAMLDSRDLSTRGGSNASDSSYGEIVSAAAFFAIDYAVRKVFQANDITFPSSLGGCIILFVFFLVADLVKDGLGNDVFTFLSPGSALLAKWLPVFFVPGLAMLPRAPSLGSNLDILKILTVIVVGCFYTLTTTAYAASVVGNGNSPEAPSAKAVEKAVKAPVAPPSLPYSQGILNTLVKSSIFMSAVSIFATRTDNDYQTPLQTLFFGLSTLAAFVYSARLPSDFTKVVHPLVTCTAITWGLVRLYAALTGSTFMNVLATYKVGSMDWKSTGPGDILLYLLGPSVVSFAISMYGRKKLLMENLAVVLTGMVVSSVGGAFGTAFFVRLLEIGGRGGGKLVRLSLIPRNVTTALAMALASFLGGDTSIAASVVVLGGILGGTYGRSILDAMGVKDPIARGLGMGAAAQGIGVSALVSEPDAFPFAAISMVLTAICFTTLVSIPAVKDLIVNIATGA